MAEEALKKVEEQLNCSICLDTYSDPKLLQCFHIYCQKCLIPLAVESQNGQLDVTCPTCRQVTPVPSGVAGLQSAFLVNRLLEIQGSLQEAENPAVTPDKAAPTGVSPDKKAGVCSVHGGKELELYCETCGELICTRCALKGGKHHDHEYAELDQAFRNYQKEITSSLEPMEKQMAIIQTALAQLDLYCEEISDQQTTIANSIYTNFRRLHEVLHIRETKLIDQLDQVTQSKLKGLAAQKDQLETILAQLGTCLYFMRESIKPGNKEDVLVMKSNTVKQVMELTTPFQADILKPFAEADMVFSTVASVTEMCTNYGELLVGLPYPSKCYLIDTSDVSLDGAVILEAVNFAGSPCKEPVRSLECQFVSEITGTRVDCSVKRRGQSQYEISYPPTIKGRHQLHIKIDEEHIRGSPFSLIVRLPVKELGTPILSINKVNKPWGVAITQSGEVLITECDRDQLSIFTCSGQKIKFFITHNSEGLRGVALDHNKNILIVDSDNHCIKKFTMKGSFITSVGTKGNGPLQFSCPTGVAVNTSNDKIYVVDYGNQRIQILNSDLTYSSTFVKFSSNNKKLLDSPMDIACGYSGWVYVTDWGNHHVLVFTAEGEFLKKFGKHGHSKGELSKPAGIAIDTSGMVYVSDMNYRISVFTPDGQFVTSFGKKGKKLGEFDSPRGLAVDNNGVVYVCDMDNNRIQFF